MNTFTSRILSTIAAGSLALSATPAFADSFSSISSSTSISAKSSVHSNFWKHGTGSTVNADIQTKLEMHCERYTDSDQHERCLSRFHKIATHSRPFVRHHMFSGSGALNEVKEQMKEMKEKMKEHREEMKEQMKEHKDEMKDKMKAMKERNHTLRDAIRNLINEAREDRKECREKTAPEARRTCLQEVNVAFRTKLKAAIDAHHAAN